MKVGDKLYYFNKQWNLIDEYIITKIKSKFYKVKILGFKYPNLYITKIYFDEINIDKGLYLFYTDKQKAVSVAYRSLLNDIKWLSHSIVAEDCDSIRDMLSKEFIESLDKLKLNFIDNITKYNGYLDESMR